MPGRRGQRVFELQGQIDSQYQRRVVLDSVGFAAAGDLEIGHSLGAVPDRVWIEQLDGTAQDLVYVVGPELIALTVTSASTWKITLEV